MNVVSHHSIKTFVSRCEAFAVRKEVKAWIASTLPKVVRKTDSLMRRVITTDEILAEWPSKADRAIADKLIEQHKAGTQFVRVANQAGLDRLFEQVRRTLDWLDALPEWDRHLRRLLRMSFDDACRLSADWHAMLERLAETGELGDAEEEVSLVAAFDGGYRMVELLDAAALVREGALMGHCVGGRGYIQSVRQGQVRILSLRDGQNRPHVTMEVRRRAAHQIKGKCNHPPVEPYAAMIRSFVMHQQLAVFSDGARIGLITVCGGTFDAPDGVVDAIVERDAEPSPDRAGTALARRLPAQARDYILANERRLSPEARLRLVEHIASNAEGAIRTTSSTAVEGPNGLSIARHAHELPRDLVELLETGLARGVEEHVAGRLAGLVDAALDRLQAAPSDIHSLAFAGGRTRFEVIAAFTGRQLRFAALTRDVQQARSQKRQAIQSAIRHATRPDIRDRAAMERSWAHANVALGRVSEAAIAAKRAADKTACVI